MNRNLEPEFGTGHLELEFKTGIWNRCEPEFGTGQSDRTKLTKKYNSYGDDVVVDRIDLKKIVEEVVVLEELTVSQDIDIVDDHDEKWVDDRFKPEVEFDVEQQQSYEQDLTNLRVLEWLNEMASDPK